MTKTVILEQAYRLFADRGFDDTSMEDIARAVGIRKASLYSHYPGKEAIYREVFAMVLRQYAALLEQTLQSSAAETSLQTHLTSIFQQYMTYYTDSLAVRFWYRALTPPDFIKEEALQAMMAVDTGYVQQLGALFAREIEAGRLREQDPGMTAMTFYQLMVGLAVFVVGSPDMDVNPFIQGSLHIFWNGVSQPASP